MGDGEPVAYPGHPESMTLTDWLVAHPGAWAGWPTQVYYDERRRQDVTRLSELEAQLPPALADAWVGRSERLRWERITLAVVAVRQAQRGRYRRAVAAYI